MRKKQMVSLFLVLAIVMVVATATTALASPKRYGPTATINPYDPPSETEEQLGQFSINRVGTRHCFDKDGTAYVVVKQPWTPYTVGVYKEIGEGAFESQDSEDAPSSQVIYDVDSRFDGTLLHIVYFDNDGSDVHINYVTFDTSSDQWGLPEVVTTLDRVPSVYLCRASVSLDSNNKPHILYTSGKKIRGTTYAHLKYKNKVGVDWSTEESVNPVDEREHRANMAVSHEDDDRFVAVWENATDSSVETRTRNSSGVWDTMGVVKASSDSPSLMTDHDGKKQVALTSSGNLYCVEGTSGANPSWTDSAILDTDARDPSITGDGSCLYILYEETTDNDIMLVVKDGTWSSPALLQESPFPEPPVVYSHVIAQNPSSLGDFDYVWSDSASYMYWDEYSL